MDLANILKQVSQSGYPDLHLQVGKPPIIRLQTGQLKTLADQDELTKESIEQVISSITTDAQKKLVEKRHELDFSYHSESGRFRVNVYQERLGPSLAFRVIPSKIPSMEDIGLGDTAKQLCNLRGGLVLVTGAAGMGKSTTLASMLDYINQSRNVHLITIEDPIEYVFESSKSLITQREVNVHTNGFADAIRSALRQDPDVVMVGEMRDLETIAAAITLAETGHLVFSTLHTPDAAQTVNRIIDVFPAYQQQQIRAQLSGVLKGVISQILVPTKDGEGRVAAREIMLGNDAIKSCISKGETHQIYSMIQLNAQSGMKLMDESLQELFEQGLITADEAIAKATDIESMQQRLAAYVK